MLRILRFLGVIGVVVGMIMIISPDASAQRGGGGGGRGGGGGGGGGRGFSGGGGSARGFSSGSSFRAPSSGMRSASPSFNTRSAPSANHLAGPNRGAVNGSSFNNTRAGNLNANNLHAGNVHSGNWSTTTWHNGNWNHNNWNHNQWAWNTWHGNWHHNHCFWPFFAFGIFGTGFGYPFGWIPWSYGYGSYAALGDYNDSPYYYYQNYPAPAQAAPGNQEQVAPMAQAPTDGTATIEALLPDASARLWVDGKETTSRGTTRRYSTPPLQEGYKYVSTIRVALQQDGEVRVVERQVPLTANGRVVVDFTQTPSRIMVNP